MKHVWESRINKKSILCSSKLKAIECTETDLTLNGFAYGGVTGYRNPKTNEDVTFFKNPKGEIIATVEKKPIY